MHKSLIIFTPLLFLLLKSLYYKFSKINNNFCRWDINYPVMDYDINRRKECNNILHFLNILNITYFLGEGSALGAYRNHGVIYKDHDYDIIIPVWMNYHIFKCHEYYLINRTKGNMDYFLSENYKLCNYTRKNLFDILIKYIHLFSDYKYIKINCRKWSVFNYTSCLFPFEKTEIDLWLILGNEYSYKKIEICKCKFCNNFGYCLTTTPNYVRNAYGNDYYIFKERNKGGNNQLKRFIIY